jgi:Ser/Thr protein kinase RdoA (MazF antagonist)
MTDFNQLSIAEQEARLLKLAYAALPQWQLEGELSLIKQRENAVYRLLTSDGQRFALRIHRAGYHSDAALAAELAWVQSLREVGIGVPSAVPTASGESFVQVSVDAVPEPRQVDLLEWVDGEQLGTVDGGLGDDEAMVRSTYLTIGQVAAKIHNQSSQWQLPAEFSRHAWDCDGLVGENPFWGRFWELEALTGEQRTLIETARQQVAQQLSRLPKTPDHYSLIHADLVPENVLVSGDRAQVIDFDDAGFGWHMFELATALYFIGEDKHYDLARVALIEGYRQHRPLSDQQLAQLPLFLAARSFTYLGWVRSRQNTETAQQLTPWLVGLCCKAAEDFLAADQL